MREQPALDEMRVAHGLLERRHNGRAAVGCSKNWPPFLGRPGGDQLCDSIARRLRVGGIVDEFGRQGNRFGKRNPEFLLDRAAGDELAVLGRVDLIAWRTTDQPQFPRFWKSASRYSERQRRPGKREH